MLFLMLTLTWITEKELERVIENERDEFCGKKNMKIQIGCETIRNASGQQGKNGYYLHDSTTELYFRSPTRQCRCYYSKTKTTNYCLKNEGKSHPCHPWQN